MAKRVAALAPAGKLVILSGRVQELKQRPSAGDDSRDEPRLTLIVERFATEAEKQ